MEFSNRMQKCRYKLKQDPEKLRKHLEKERERDKKRRHIKKVSMDKYALDEERKRKSERQRKYRNSKRSMELDKISTNCPIGSYKSKRSLKKAVTKIKKNLPQSPSKRRAVLFEIATEILPSEVSKIFHTTERKKSNAISEEAIQKIKQYYMRDDVSRQSPGIKDCKSIKDPKTGKRSQVQKRYLITSLRECYSHFKQENPDVRVGKSVFCSYRPQNICTVSEIPHDVCVCIYHANFNFLVEAAHSIFPSIPSSSKEFLDMLCCDVKNENCMTNQCNKCDRVEDVIPLKYHPSLPVSLKQWSKGAEGRVQVTTQKSTMSGLLKIMNSKLLKFKTHVFVKNEQTRFFTEKRESTSQTEAVLQLDFAENFAIISQDEVQSAHWRHNQATVFTACAWVSNSSQEVECHSYGIISDDLTHSKYCVWEFLRTVLTDIKENNKNLTKVSIYSDGCAAQFKNRYNLFNICTAKDDFGVDITW